MACKDCSSNIQGVCDCCKLVDGDNTFKEVFYCEECGAYLCKTCNGKYLKRGAAMVIDKADKMYKYFQRLKSKLLN